ncbi:phage terminase small subunit P27 family [uncultured Clostridium sp.]|uniref:phage terminase small subunit P27 family n=1 Tax=uncultured Clostridium sp. TaxID=59620 RepID=UPI00261840E1|nr:phage terminase small subunit P27 family [uncultured Clostridium sp.]
MPNVREPIEVIMKKGKKNLTKEEIATRMNQELKVDSESISIPEFLPSKFKKQFLAMSERLQKVYNFTDLDTDLLARYFIAKDFYNRYNKKLRTEFDRKKVDFSLIKDIQNSQDKAFKQMRACANDLGLSLSSRCKLVVPDDDPNEYEL